MTRGLREESVLLRIQPDVTRLTNLGKTTIYQEINSGRLRTVKIGRSVRIRRADLEDWIEQRSREQRGRKK